MKKQKLLACMLAGALWVGGTSAQAALDLPATGYVTYGNFNSYSLPILAFINDQQHGGGVGPGTPFYVKSSPGEIKDLIVVATGAGGKPVNTNFAGMDNAYSTPNSSGIPFFSTATFTHPGTPGAPFPGDQSNTWNTTLSALSTFLNGESPVFLFNNNQVNSGASTNQNLAVWAQVSLTGDNLPTLFFDFTNRDSKFALVTEGGGGVPNGDPTAFTSTGAGPIAGDNNHTDYVLSGGAICLAADFAAVSCSDPAAVSGPINHNLGANQAVYALVLPALNAILATPNFGGYTTMHLDLRMGCDPNTAQGSCTGRDLNNGYEQLFISTATIQQPPPVNVPEPATAALLGVGLLGIFASVSRRRKLD